MVKQNEKKTIRAWQTNPSLHKDFIDECLDQIAKYGYLGTSLVPQSWQRIRDSLRQKHPDINMGNHKFFKNHWDQLKKKYIAWRYLKSQEDGNHFIQETGLFDYSDEQWDYFIQKNRDCAQFRRNPLEYADELSNVFEGILGTGESGVTPCAMTPLTNNVDHCTSGTSKRKRVEIQSDPAVLERIVNLLERQLERTSAVSPGTMGSLVEPGEGVEYSLRQCLEMISAMRIELIIPDDVVHLATVKLSQSSQFRKDFMELQDSTHKIWLLNGLALQK